MAAMIAGNRTKRYLLMDWYAGALATHGVSCVDRVCGLRRDPSASRKENGEHSTPSSEESTGYQGGSPKTNHVPIEGGLISV
jgi:hypothetical protein